MKQKLLLCLVCAMLCSIRYGYSQEADQPSGGLLRVPGKFLDRLDRKLTGLQGDLTKQTEKYLEKERKREEKLRRKLMRLDSNAAKTLFDGSAEKYAALADKMKNDTGSAGIKIDGQYQAYTDSIKGALSFLSANPQLDGKLGQQAGQVASQLQSLQAKLRDAAQIKDLVKQRRQQISDYISQHSNLSGVLGKEYQAMNQELYYYSQRIHQYREMLNDPNKLEMEALAVLRKVPAFTDFMKQHSEFALLFNLPSGYGSAEALEGLQTKDQVAALIQSRFSTSTPGGVAAVTSSISAAQTQLDGYKSKLSSLGSGNANIDLPDFKPNQQKLKSFLRRLEYGANLQTTRSNYFFPTTSDIGVSVGYKINDKSTIGIGASYKIGWGNGWNHISFTSQGLGLRSFLDLKIKGSFFASGGFEYNYAKPFGSLQQLHYLNDWTRSGLIGVSKIISVKSRAFKKTKVQVLWDFLSYSQVPKTQAFIFRFGYVWR